MDEEWPPSEAEEGASADRSGKTSRQARSNRSALQEGDPVIFVDRKNRRYLRVLRAKAEVSVRGAQFSCDEIIGRSEGTLVQSSQGERFRVLRPTYAHLIPCLPREAQVIYPKDAGQILVGGDIYPGAIVVEVGVGPGALTIALLRAVGPAGRVISYEIRPDFCAMARKNIASFCGEVDNWELVNADATRGIEVRDADRLVVDIAEPWLLVEPAGECLRAGGGFVSFVPTVLQLKAIVDALETNPAFALVEAVETLARFWHVRKLSVRPEHRMVAHTGFIVTARRVV